MFGSPETTPGGRALKFYSSVRLDIRRIGALKAGNDTVGNQTRVKVVKNKVAPPFKMVEFDVMYGEGISQEGSLLDIGIENGVVQKSGAWFAYGDERLGQGRENAKLFLKENDGGARAHPRRHLREARPRPEPTTKRARASRKGSRAAAGGGGPTRPSRRCQGLSGA